MITQNIYRKPVWKLSLLFTYNPFTFSVSYRSFEAFSSRTASFMAGPRRALAKHKMLVVFPVPGGP